MSLFRELRGFWMKWVLDSTVSKTSTWLTGVVELRMNGKGKNSFRHVGKRQESETGLGSPQGVLYYQGGGAHALMPVEEHILEVPPTYTP
ncbi:hypothetical protein D9613_011750 [Agrocybe pediades]|uniref:Uncharacterized protein n=1 Tax=Agrocybe pediades TaxID=84607 RepID=A0A8H4VLX9_9AGAR|nr:hypothetical protein D9613_011750 [Agrocybe pediades]